MERLYDSVETSFEQLRTKALALIAGEVAIVAFLFATNTNLGSMVPVYGIVFYGLGVFLLALSFILLLSVVATVHWKHPVGANDVKKLNEYSGNVEKFLTFIKNDHAQTISYCTNKLNARANRFSAAIYALSIGLFLLIVIKYGGNLVRISS
jgi:hypothetical protein